MIKKLTRLGNSQGVIIDKPILELLGMTADATVVLTTDGKRLIIEKRPGLPRFLKGYFWQYEFDALSLEDDGELIIAQLLAAGGPDAIAWLREAVGDPAIRRHLRRTRGRGLSYGQLAHWIDRRTYDAWVKQRPPSLWEKR